MMVFAKVAIQKGRDVNGSLSRLAPLRHRAHQSAGKCPGIGLTRARAFGLGDAYSVIVQEVSGRIAAMGSNCLLRGCPKFMPS